MSAMKKRKQSVSKEEVRIISSTTSTKASGEKSRLPMDIILEVFSRLPAKSIASHVPIDYPIRVCVPACGLLCTKDEWVLSRKKDARMMICNPSTGGFKLLPKVKTRRGRVMTYLGYDPIEEVYKVLCMTACERPYIQKAEQHQVLTLGTGKLNWRMIECPISHYPRPRDNEICINGVLYYSALESGSWRTSTSMIVCFDIRSEKLKFIVDEAFKDFKSPSTLINYKGKLGILSPHTSGFMDGIFIGFELWVIDDIEKPTWWRHTHIFPPLWDTLVAQARINIVGTTGDSEIMFSPTVVSNPFYIFCYNMETRSIRRVEIKGFGPVTGQNIYTFLNHVENVKLIT
ncbi:hypothetical protein HID58_081808 [Brassica napus]|uniref:F-box associated beta-propeller type 3 domain-containing protein n=1 Tax=Brassica napus TaxID=3708 RepID=A0ABQ7YAH6_BRANA|nr:hypothetical protein HID58_081808 [Brassica napus]